MKSLPLVAFGLLLLTGAAHAQAQDPSGTYLSESGETRVRITKCGQAYCGTIVSIQGEAKDVNNPDAKLKGRNLVGVQMLSNIQPTAEGFRNLEKLGIRTVINLRYFNSDDDEAEGTRLQLHRVKILTWRAGDDHVVEVMRLLRDRDQGPFLIHCQHGADRTGLMSAMYRMLEQDWTAQEALEELIDGGYGFHSLWKNIKAYVLAADVDTLRRRISD